MYIDDAALDPTTMELRSQEKPGRACTHHENTHISNHVELLLRKPASLQRRSGAGYAAISFGTSVERFLSIDAFSRTVVKTATASLCYGREAIVAA